MLCQGSAGVVSVMVAAAGGCWAAIQLYQVSIVVVVVVAVVVVVVMIIVIIIVVIVVIIIIIIMTHLPQEAWIRMLAVGLALLVQYICLRFHLLS